MGGLRPYHLSVGSEAVHASSSSSGPSSAPAETPNTRSRRKRELNDDAEDHEEGGRVTWQDSTRLKRMFRDAAAGQEVPLPSPTQKPEYRPVPRISDPTSSSSTARPSRKRPCRSNRSLPAQLSTSTPDGGGPNAARSSSMPTHGAGMDDDRRLEDLLDQANKMFSVQTISGPVGGKPSSSGSGGEGGEDGGKRRTASPFQRQNSSESCGSAARGAPSDKGKGPRVDSPKPIDAVIVPVTHVLNHRSTKHNNNATNTRTTPRVPTTSKSTPAHPPHAASSPASKTPTLSQTRSGPRVGLSSRPKQPLPSSTTSVHHPASRSNGPSHAFKPPFIQNAPIRCSPRRPPSTRPVYSTHTPSKFAPAPAPVVAPPAKKAKDAPSSDSVGDESFDSFDGMFQAGGEDIEALLKAMDGS